MPTLGRRFSPPPRQLMSKRTIGAPRPASQLFMALLTLGYLLEPDVRAAALRATNPVLAEFDHELESNHVVSSGADGALKPDKARQ